MSGPTGLRSLRPELEVLCMSGYDAVDAGEDPDIAYLQKPFTATALATAVRRVLDAAAPDARR